MGKEGGFAEIEKAVTAWHENHQHRIAISVGSKAPSSKSTSGVDMSAYNKMMKNFDK